MERTAAAAGPQGISRRTWFMGGLAAAILVAVALAAVRLAGSEERATFEPGSPEAAVQAYAQAWGASDVDAAWALLTPRAQGRIHEPEFRHAASWEDDAPTRVWIDERDDYDDRVVLSLSIERTWDGLFGPDRDIQTLRLTLVQHDGAWRIDTPLLGFFPG